MEFALGVLLPVAVVVVGALALNWVLGEWFNKT